MNMNYLGGRRKHLHVIIGTQCVLHVTCKYLYLRLLYYTSEKTLLSRKDLNKSKSEF